MDIDTQIIETPPIPLDGRGKTSYILRDIPDDLWLAAKHRAVDEGVSLRDIVIRALRKELI